MWIITWSLFPCDWAAGWFVGEELKVFRILLLTLGRLPGINPRPRITHPPRYGKPCSNHGCVCSVMGKNRIHGIRPTIRRVALEYGLLKDILTIIYYQTSQKMHIWYPLKGWFWVNSPLGPLHHDIQPNTTSEGGFRDLGKASKSPLQNLLKKKLVNSTLHRNVLMYNWIISVVHTFLWSVEFTSFCLTLESFAEYFYSLSPNPGSGVDRSSSVSSRQ